MLSTLWSLTAPPAETQALYLNAVLPYAQAPAANPMKGFVPYPGNYHFPHSMEYQYVGFADLHPAPNVFNCRAVLEPKLEEIANRGNQAIFRVYLDYPDNSTSVPQYLLDSGLTLTPYTEHGGGQAPNYNHPALVDAMEQLIQELGANYDGDSRLAYWQMGFLGFWGEWHTWPLDELMANRQTQERILTAFSSAFEKTPLLVSQDSFSYEPVHHFTAYGIGFHDDAFTEGTLGPDEWMFVPRLQRFGYSEHWKHFPIGGEVLPAHQATIWSSPSGSPQDFFECVQQTHATWLINHELFEGAFSEAQLANAMQGSRSLGYEITVQAAESALTESSLALRITLQNHGVAPFYGNWPLQISVQDSSGNIHFTGNMQYSLSSLLPGEPAIVTEQLAGEFSLSALQDSSLKICVQPPDSRLKPLVFANEGQQGNWLTLGNYAQKIK